MLLFTLALFVLLVRIETSPPNIILLKVPGGLALSKTLTTFYYQLGYEEAPQKSILSANSEGQVSYTVTCPSGSYSGTSVVPSEYDPLYIWLPISVWIPSGSSPEVCQFDATLEVTPPVSNSTSFIAYALKVKTDYSRIDEDSSRVGLI